MKEISGDNIVFKQVGVDILYFSLHGLVIPETPPPPIWWGQKFPGLDKFFGHVILLARPFGLTKNRHAKPKSAPNGKTSGNNAFFYILMRTGGFQFQCISIGNSCSENILVSDGYLNGVSIPKHPSQGVHKNMMKARNFKWRELTKIIPSLFAVTETTPFRTLLHPSVEVHSWPSQASNRIFNW